MAHTRGGVASRVNSRVLLSARWARRASSRATLNPAPSVGHDLPTQDPEEPIGVWCRPQCLTPRSEIKSAHGSPHTWSPSHAGPIHLLPRTDRVLLLTTGA